MSAQEIVSAAVLSALENHVPLSGELNGVFALRPDRTTPPYAVVGDMLASDWSTKTEVGREIRFVVTLHEHRENAHRLGTLMAAAETAIESIPRDLTGWRIASCVFLRSRITRGERPWVGTLEYRVRLLSLSP